MAKPEWGVKRQCASCGTRFYDLTRDPILCPECGTVFEIASLVRGKRARAGSARVDAEKKPEAAVADDIELDVDIDDDESADDDVVIDDDGDSDDVVVPVPATTDDEDTDDDPIEADDPVLLDEDDDLDSDDTLGEFGDGSDDEDRR